MKSIVVTYPNVRALPKGIKRMLVASESLFFGQARRAPVERNHENLFLHAVLKEGKEGFRGRPLVMQHLSWRNSTGKARPSVRASSDISQPFLRRFCLAFCAAAIFALAAALIRRLFLGRFLVDAKTFLRLPGKLIRL